MNKLDTLFRDIVISLFMTLGVFSFMSGEFIISSMLFGVACLYSNIQFIPEKKSNNRKLSRRMKFDIRDEEYSYPYLGLPMVNANK